MRPMARIMAERSVKEHKRASSVCDCRRPPLERGSRMIRTFCRSAVVSATLIITASHPARAQQTQTKPPAETKSQPQTQTRKGPPESFTSSAIERSYAGGGGVPSRRTQTRTESNGREVVTEVTETVGVDGRMKVSLETTSETARTAGGTIQTKQARSEE